MGNLTETEELELLELENEEALAKQQSSSARPIEEATNQSLPLGDIAKTAMKVATTPISPFENRLATKEARGVGQGAIQGTTFGYGMPLLRKAIPGSGQVPQPTTKENIVGQGLATIPQMAIGGAIPLGGKLAKAGVVAGSAALGYGMNPSDTDIVGLEDKRRAFNAALGLTGGTIGVGLGMLGKGIIPKGVDALKRALKPGKNNNNFDQAAASAIKSIQKSGVDVDNNLETFIEASKEAKKQTWAKIQKAIDTSQGKMQYNETGILTNGIQGNNIKERMISVIVPESKKLTPEMGKAINKAASKYEGQQITIAEAEDRLQQLNSELTNFFKASARGAYVKGNEPMIAAKIAERKILRQELLDSVNNLSGTNIEPLKREYGALMNIQDEAMGRLNVSNRQNPISLQEAINGAFGVGRLLTGDISGLFQIGGAMTAKHLNKSGVLASRAVKTFGKKPLNLGIMGGVIGSQSGNILQK